MQTENNLLLDIEHYADSDYNAESSFRYKFFLVIAPQQMTTIIADEQINRIVSIKTFTNKKVSFLDMDYNDLKLLTQITDEFLPNYKSKTVIIANDASILVPDSLNNSVELETYYKVNKKVLLLSQVLYNKLNFKSIVNVFNVRNEILKFVRFNMPTADIIHQSLLFIKACFNLPVQQTNENLFIHINPDYIDVLQFSNDEVSFFNSFKYDNQTDIVYYILAVAEQLGITLNLQLTIFGNIDSNDTLFALLNKYCKNMHFGKRNSRFSYPITLENVPQQYHFTALNVLLCE